MNNYEYVVWDNFDDVIHRVPWHVKTFITFTCWGGRLKAGRLIRKRSK